MRELTQLSHASDPEGVSLRRRGVPTSPPNVHGIVVNIPFGTFGNTPEVEGAKTVTLTTYNGP